MKSPEISLHSSYHVTLCNLLLLFFSEAWVAQNMWAMSTAPNFLD